MTSPLRTRADAMSTCADLTRFAAELQAPTLVSPVTLQEATTVEFPGVDGVLPGFGRQKPNDWGLGFEIRDGKGIADRIELLAETWPKRPQIRPDGVRNELSWVFDGFKRLDVQLVENLVTKSQYRLQHLRISGVNQQGREWLANLDCRLLARRVACPHELEHDIHVPRQRFVNAISVLIESLPLELSPPS